MDKFQLTAARARELFHYDPETGILMRKVATSNCVKVGDRVGTPNGSGHLQVEIDHRCYQVHRVCFLVHTGRWPEGTLDHEDTDPSNNKWDNLRDVTHQINCQNVRRARSTSSTGLLGVSVKRNKFQARIEVDGVRRFLGTFATPELAHGAYVAAKRELHAGCTL